MFKNSSSSGLSAIDLNCETSNYTFIYENIENVRGNHCKNHCGQEPTRKRQQREATDL